VEAGQCAAVEVLASWHVIHVRKLAIFGDSADGAGYILDIYMVNYLLTAPPNIYTRCWDVGM
jgi:hypothetical protein